MRLSLFLSLSFFFLEVRECYFSPLKPSRRPVLSFSSSTPALTSVTPQDPQRHHLPQQRPCTGGAPLLCRSDLITPGPGAGKTRWELDARARGAAPRLALSGRQGGGCNHLWAGGRGLRPGRLGGPTHGDAGEVRHPEPVGAPGPPPRTPCQGSSASSERPGPREWVPEFSSQGAQPPARMRA